MNIQINYFNILINIKKHYKIQMKFMKIFKYIILKQMILKRMKKILYKYIHFLIKIM